MATENGNLSKRDEEIITEVKIVLEKTIRRLKQEQYI